MRERLGSQYYKAFCAKMRRTPDWVSGKNDLLRKATRDARTRRECESVLGNRKVNGVSRRRKYTLHNTIFTWTHTNHGQSAGYPHYQRMNWISIKRWMATCNNCVIKLPISTVNLQVQRIPTPISRLSTIDGDLQHCKYVLHKQFETLARDPIVNLGSRSRFSHETCQKRVYRLVPTTSHHTCQNHHNGD